jgi:hypothetical protein
VTLLGLKAAVAEPAAPLEGCSADSKGATRAVSAVLLPLPLLPAEPGSAARAAERNAAASAAATAPCEVVAGRGGTRAQPVSWAGGRAQGRTHAVVPR